jgi:hypothetical protein
MGRIRDEAKEVEYNQNEVSSSKARWSRKGKEKE